jgi:hypothetical protein
MTAKCFLNSLDVAQMMLEMDLADGLTAKAGGLANLRRLGWASLRL